MKKAFTLIELLVVIAIIAILAAILFPVFAQAKLAAKATAALSNTKQDDLAILMYSNDVDDKLPLGTSWNTGNDQLCYGAGTCFSTWAWVTQPYTKNSNIFLDPTTSPNPALGTLPQRLVDTYYTQFGYNYTWLSPYVTDPLGGEDPTSTSATSFSKPSQTVMIASKWNNKDNQSGFDWATSFPPPGQGGMLAGPGIDAPSCWTIPQWCLYGWGGVNDSGSFFWGQLKLSITEGGQTGGMALRASNQATVAWLDGHSTKNTAGSLAVGTTWTPTADGGVTVTDSTKYLWGGTQ